MYITDASEVRIVRGQDRPRSGVGSVQRDAPTPPGESARAESDPARSLPAARPARSARGRRGEPARPVCVMKISAWWFTHDSHTTRTCHTP